MVLDLPADKTVILSGPRADLAGLTSAEVAVVRSVSLVNGFSVLELRDQPAHRYLRSGLAIHANVVAATHGESEHEVLGSGEAARPWQRFTLRRTPTTYVAAATADGMRSTLQVRVDGLLWSERPSLFGAGPDEHVYATRIDDEGRTHVLFGDGQQGARLPTGQLNVQARYRSGSGPDGEVAAGTLTLLRAQPLGLRGVHNPLPTSAAQGPEKLADARHNAPLTLLAFDRVVSLTDFAHYARAFPNIDKACADLAQAPDGNRVVVLSVVGPAGKPPDTATLRDLRAAIRAQSDGSLRFDVQPATLLHFRCSARLFVDPRHKPAVVQALAQERLLAAFGHEMRDLAQSVAAAEIVQVLHQTAGVLAVDLDALQLHDVPVAPDRVEQLLPARRGHWVSGGALPTAAELLLIDPEFLTLTAVHSPGRHP